MIFDRVEVGAGGGWQGVGVLDGGSLGPDPVGRGQLGVRWGQQEQDEGRAVGARWWSGSTGLWGGY